MIRIFYGGKGFNIARGHTVIFENIAAYDVKGPVRFRVFKTPKRFWDEAKEYYWDVHAFAESLKDQA